MDFWINTSVPDQSLLPGVIELYKALRDDDKAQAVDAYERWGFVGLDNEAIDVPQYVGWIYLCTAS